MYLVTFLLTVGGGLCKETGFMAVFVSAVYEFLFNSRYACVYRRVAILTTLGVFMLIWRNWYTNGTEVNMSVQDNPVSFETLHSIRRILSYAYIHGKYFLLLFVWPGVTLSYDYSLSAIPIIRSLDDCRNLLSVCVYLCVFGLLHICCVKRIIMGLFSMSIVLIPWLPASNILFPVGTVIGERLLYTSSVGVVLLCSSALRSDSSRLKYFLYFVLFVYYWIRTGFRVLDWSSGDSLFVRDGHSQPFSSKTQFNLGITYMSSKQYDRAIPALIRCAAADPMSALPYWRIGQIEILRGNFKTAESWLMEASTKFSATLMIKDEEIFHDIAVAVFQNKKIERAHFYLGLALEINPNFPKGLNNFGCLLASTDALKSVQYLNKAVSLNPHNYIYLSNLLFMAKYTKSEKIVNSTKKIFNQNFPQVLTSQLKNDCVWEFVPAT